MPQFYPPICPWWLHLVIYSWVQSVTPLALLAVEQTKSTFLFVVHQEAASYYFSYWDCWDNFLKASYKTLVCLKRWQTRNLLLNQRFKEISTHSCLQRQHRKSKKINWKLKWMVEKRRHFFNKVAFFFSPFQFCKCKSCQSVKKISKLISGVWQWRLFL